MTDVIQRVIFFQSCEICHSSSSRRPHIKNKCAAEIRLKIKEKKISGSQFGNEVGMDLGGMGKGAEFP